MTVNYAELKTHLESHKLTKNNSKAFKDSPLDDHKYLAISTTNIFVLHCVKKGQ